MAKETVNILPPSRTSPGAHGLSSELMMDQTQSPVISADNEYSNDMFYEIIFAVYDQSRFL